MAHRVQALILAGGMGRRLGRLGEAIPKCLLTVGRQTVLQRLVDQCLAAGVEEVLLSVSSHFAALIEAAVSRLESPVPVRCVVDTEPRGTAAALASLAPLTSDAVSLLVLGDEYFSSRTPFAALAQRLPTMAPGTMEVGVVRRSTPRQLSCLVVCDAAARVRRIEDKPAQDQLEGDTRWACFAAIGPGALEPVRAAAEAGGFRSPHIGDALDVVVQAGASTGAVETDCLEININGADEALLAHLVQTRLDWRDEGMAFGAFDPAIDVLCERLDVPRASLPA